MLIFFKEKVAVVTVIVAVKAVEAAVAVDVVGREPLHYGIRADIFLKSYQRMFSFKN